MTLRKPVIAGNWKMNMLYSGAVKLAQTISDQEKSDQWTKSADVILLPPYTVLRGVSNVIDFDKSLIVLGAQNVYPADEGAYTGEISPLMIADLDCSYCLVGHSERRAMGETNQQVNEKAKALLSHNIIPIICCGEPLDINEEGRAAEYVSAQILDALAGLDATKQFIIAYEPIWAIGTGKIAAPSHADKIAQTIREVIAQSLNQSVAQETRILYGGSVKPGNAGAFVAPENIDGVLVGGASLEADIFSSIIQEVIDNA